jgi:hypothetical protein
MARLLNPARLFGFAAAAALLIGYRLPLADWVTPQRGLGYALGITGGSLMLLLALYPARKRAQWLAFLGSVPLWFRMHMVLGIVGPIFILFHSGFKFGATNSNVALICMLLVSGSGIIGRYFYVRIYDEMLGRQATLEEVQARADLLQKQTSAVTVLPDMLAAIDQEERRLLSPAGFRLGTLLHPLTAGWRAWMARLRLRRRIVADVLRAAAESEQIAAQADRLFQVAYGYACRRLDTQRRIAEYRMYAGLFSGWHLFHVPMYLMLILTGIAHVIAVHIY